MTDLVDLTDKEKAFLGSMVAVGDINSNMGAQEAAEYKGKYGCDPCEACGPDACADCNGCAENYASHGQINPFSRISR